MFLVTKGLYIICPCNFSSCFFLKQAANNMTHRYYTILRRIIDRNNLSLPKIWQRTKELHCLNLIIKHHRHWYLIGSQHSGTRFKWATTGLPSLNIILVGFLTMKASFIVVFCLYFVSIFLHQACAAVNGDRGDISGDGERDPFEDLNVSSNRLLFFFFSLLLPVFLFALDKLTKAQQRLRLDRTTRIGPC